jgi:hypothetical protein
LIQATLGTALGAALSVGFTRLLRSLLLEVDPLDPVIFVIAWCRHDGGGRAGVLPAWGGRGTKIEPRVVLKAE